jgi:hypothetical protein
MSVPLQALRGFAYAGRRLVAGEKFEARGESDARVLCAVEYATRHIQVPEPLPEVVVPPVATKRGKGYRTEALVAQAAADAAPETPGTTPLAMAAQASESGTAEKPEPGKLEAAPAADAAPSRRRYTRRDLSSGADE